MRQYFKKLYNGDFGVGETFFFHVFIMQLLLAIPGYLFFDLLLGLVPTIIKNNFIYNIFVSILQIVFLLFCAMYQFTALLGVLNASNKIPKTFYIGLAHLFSVILLLINLGYFFGSIGQIKSAISSAYEQKFLKNEVNNETIKVVEPENIVIEKSEPKEEVIVIDKIKYLDQSDFDSNFESIASSWDGIIQKYAGSNYLVYENIKLLIDKVNNSIPNSSNYGVKDWKCRFYRFNGNQIECWSNSGIYGNKYILYPNNNFDLREINLHTDDDISFSGVIKERPELKIVYPDIWIKTRPIILFNIKPNSIKKL